MKTKVTHVDARVECDCGASNLIQVTVEDPTNWETFLQSEIEDEAVNIGWSRSGECPECIEKQRSRRAFKSANYPT